MVVPHRDWLLFRGRLHAYVPALLLHHAELPSERAAGIARVFVGLLRKG